ncbi:MAG: hypothetical protein AB8B55_23775 [Mariniblastus sp.]
MRQLHREYSSSNDAEILIVYQKEPHAGQLAFKEIEQPETVDQRRELAKRMKDEYELPMTVLVDTMEDQSRALFSDLPSPAFVIDSEGIVRAKFPWADAETIRPAVFELNKKSKRNGMSIAIWIAIFLPLFVVLLTRMTNAKSKEAENGGEGDPNSVS